MESTQTSGHRSSLAFPQLFFLSINGLLLMLWYARHETVIAELALVPPDFWATLHFHAYLFTLIGVLVVVLWSITLLESRFRPDRRPFSGWVALGLLSILWILVVMDTRLYETIGVHTYSPLVLETLSNPDANRELHLDGAATRSLILLCVGVVVGQVLLRFGSHWLVERYVSGPRGHLVGWLVTAVMLASAVTMMGTRAPAQSAASYLDALPLYAELLAEPRFDAEAGSVTYPTASNSGSSRSASPEQALWTSQPAPEFAAQPDILFVMAESLRADHFTPELMPGVHALMEERECAALPRHYSGGHTTEYGVFTLLYSLNGYHYEPFERDDVVSYPLSVLRAGGYSLIGASASQLKAWNGGEYMFQPFSHYQEFVDVPADEGDALVVESVIKRAGETPGPRFAFAFFNSTHHNYLYPPSRERFTPVLDRDYDHFLGDDRLAEQREPILNRYRNSVGWVDELTADLVSRFPRTDRGLVVVFTGDHGEEFWEHGLLGHGAARFVEERISVPLLLCASGATELASPVELSAHVDIWPTLLELLDVQGVAPLEQWSSGQPLQHPRKPGEDAVYVGGLDFPWDFPTMALIDGERKYWMQLCTTDELCVEPFRVTDMADQPLDVSAGREALANHVEQLYQEMGRWVQVKSER